MNLLKKLGFGDELANVRKKTDQVLKYEKTMRQLSETDLKEKTQTFKDRLGQGESLTDIAPEAFAVCREASRRVLGMEHFPVQVTGGWVLFQGDIAEMKTGEGKTLVVTLPAYVMALTGKKVHIITVNEYLVQRDAAWMGKLFDFLGLSTAPVLSDQSRQIKQKAYQSDIVYLTNSEAGFDYLRDHMVLEPHQKVQGSLDYAIIDEVDSVLIDEARTPLIITSPTEKPSDLYYQADEFVLSLKDEDIELEPKERKALLTEAGIKKAETYFQIDNLTDIEHITLYHHIQTAIQARYIYKKDVEYIVRDGKVVLIDSFTGRLQPTKRFSEGIHQAIEVKEGVEMNPENAVDATITYQNLFTLYETLSGMTGTAKTEEDEFHHIYGLNVYQIPTNKPIARDDREDLVYKTEKEKWEAVVQAVRERYEKKQPILIGTVSVEVSEALSRKLKAASVPHTVLNAKHHEKEASIIAQAGKPGAVTIATNMAGRGTDIVLGGNAEKLAEDYFMKERGASLLSVLSNETMEEAEKNKAKDRYRFLIHYFKKQTEAYKTSVIDSGGLCVIGTERHESRRIDNQLRGRSGRQGDPGESLFFLSLEDGLLKHFSGEKVKMVADSLQLPYGTPISSKMLSNIVEHSQKKIESMNYQARKNLKSFDTVLNGQRKVIYQQRDRVMKAEPKELLDMVMAFTEETIDQLLNPLLHEAYPEAWPVDKIEVIVQELSSGLITVPTIGEDTNSRQLKDHLTDQFIELIEKHYPLEDEYAVKQLRSFLLISVDENWKQYIEEASTLKRGIGLRAYGQQNPLIAFQKEADLLYQAMLETIRENYLKKLCAVVHKHQQEPPE